MKKALILHGRGGHSQGAWFPWLKSELEELGYLVDLPDLPNSNNPILSEQMGVILDSDYDLIVGHSLGCQLTINLLQRDKKDGKNIVLVAPSYPGLGEDLGKEFIGDSYDNLSSYFNSKVELKTIKNNNFSIFLSDDDFYIDMEKAKKYYSDLDAKIVEFKGMGHFNSVAGVTKLPELLDYIDN